MRWWICVGMVVSGCSKDNADTAGGPTGPAPYEGAHGGQMVRVAAQTFEMGCTAGQSDCDYDESPAHAVTLTQDFYIGETEVTQGQYEAMMGTNPSTFPECGGDCPVEEVTWYDAAQFANAVSAAEGLSSCYTCAGDECEPVADLYGCAGYRLPTEAEWEAAARCGEDLLYAGSDDLDAVGWYEDNSDSTTHPVAQKAPNACGLYDMSGNVWEWVNDWYDDEYYSNKSHNDPYGPESGGYRVGRGGSWNYIAQYARVASRYWNNPGNRYFSLGFRLVLPVAPAGS